MVEASDWSDSRRGLEWTTHGVGDLMKLIDRPRNPIIENTTNEVDSRGHHWERTGVTLLLSQDSAVERCAACHSYRIRGQVRWEDDGTSADACPEKPLHWWEV